MKNVLRLGMLGTTAAVMLVAPSLPLPGFEFGASPAFAANNGNHGNSGSHGNGNGNAFGQSVQEASLSNDTGNAGSAGHENIAALAGAGNAAHASIQGLLHANPNSAVGRVKAYADANFAAKQADTTTATALTACNAALSNAGVSGDCSTLSSTALQAALATLDPAVAANITTLYGTYTTDKVASAAADATVQTDLAAVTKNASNPAVQAYIDNLLSKYYAYLGG